jgi:hypothetical protein
MQLRAGFPHGDVAPAGRLAGLGPAAVVALTSAPAGVATAGLSAYRKAFDLLISSSETVEA